MKKKIIMQYFCCIPDFCSLSVVGWCGPSQRRDLVNLLCWPQRVERRSQTVAFFTRGAYTIRVCSAIFNNRFNVVSLTICADRATEAGDELTNGFLLHLCLSAQLYSFRRLVDTISSCFGCSNDSINVSLPGKIIFVHMQPQTFFRTFTSRRHALSCANYRARDRPRTSPRLRCGYDVQSERNAGRTYAD